MQKHQNIVVKTRKEVINKKPLLQLKNANIDLDQSSKSRRWIPRRTPRTEGGYQGRTPRTEGGYQGRTTEGKVNSTTRWRGPKTKVVEDQAEGGYQGRAKNRRIRTPRTEGGYQGNPSEGTWIKVNSQNNRRRRRRSYSRPSTGG